MNRNSEPNKQSSSRWDGRSTKILVTIMFTDIKGFTDMIDRFGDHEGRRIVEMHNQLIQETVEEGKGKVHKFVGDAVLATFPSPSEGVSRALEIQRKIEHFNIIQRIDPPLQVRIGLHLGEMITSDSGEEMIGHHINTASRVMDSADGGQILTTPSVYETSKGFFQGVKKNDIRWVNHGTFHLKGIGSMELYEVLNPQLRTPQLPQSAKNKRCESNFQRLELSGYKVKRRVGEGLMGVVYQAELKKTSPKDPKKTVAIKVLRSGLEEKPEALKQFVQGAQTLANISYPGVVQIHDLHTDAHPPFFVMDWVSGHPISQIGEKVTWREKAKIMEKVCRIVDHVHRQGVLHSALKPSNIIISPEGEPTILDFGLSLAFKLPDSTQDSKTIDGHFESLFYVAPEQIQGKLKPSSAVDVYALGVILYELLTGQPPFNQDSVHTVLDGHLHDDPLLPSQVNPEIPDDLQRIVLQAMEKLPNKRFKSAGEMADILLRFQAGDRVKLRPRILDNLVRSRVQKQINEIDGWFNDQLITPYEHARLSRAYRRLNRSGLQAVMESRIVYFGMLMLYLGGWLILNGSAIWLTQFWKVGWLEQSLGRIVVGCSPSILANTLWLLYWWRGGYRQAFVLMIVGLLSLPVAMVTALHELGVRYDLFWLYKPWGGSDALFDGGSLFGTLMVNTTLFFALLFSLAWTLILGHLTRTVTASVVATIFSVLLYLVFLDFYGLRDLFSKDNLATGAIWLIPLVIGILATGRFISDTTNRKEQCSPWFGTALLLSLIISQMIALRGPGQWAFNPWKEKHSLYEKHDNLSEIEKFFRDPTDIRNLVNKILHNIEENHYNAKDLLEKFKSESTRNRESIPKSVETTLDKTLDIESEIDAESFLNEIESQIQEYRNLPKLEESIFEDKKYREWINRYIIVAHMPTVGIAESICGLLYLALGVFLRRHFPIDAMVAYIILISLAPVAFLGGFEIISFHWPKAWGMLTFSSKEFQPPFFPALALSLGTVLMAHLLRARPSVPM